MNKMAKIVGIIVGVVIFFAGITISTQKIKDYGDYRPDYAAFGADYYTESYAAMRYTALNAANTVECLEELSKKITSCFGSVVMTIGAVTAIFYANKLVEAISAERKEAEELVEAAVTQMQRPDLPDQWYCSQCGAANSTNNAICKKCGQYKNG